jgi:signal transduction histidine kinase
MLGDMRLALPFAPPSFLGAHTGLPPDWRLSFNDAIALVRRGTGSRIGFTVVAALIASAVLPSLWLVLWCAFMAAWELALRPFLENRIAVPAAARSERVGYVWLAAINVVGAFAYSVFPLAAWATGNSLGMVMATGWVCGSANHLFVYFSNQRWLLLGCVIPMMICAMSAPFIAEGGLTLMSLLGALVLLVMVGAGAVFGRDRRVLLHALSQHDSARAAAEQASAAKSQFMATMSHELRTPLNAVIGYSELIAEEAPEAVGEDARKIREAAGKLLGLVNVILDISRLETGAVTLQRERFDAAVILEQLRESAAALAALNNNTISFVEANPLGEVELDHARLYQALLQLVSNAAKFTNNGEVKVIASRSEKGGRDILSFAVTDTGCGIAAAQLEQIFEPFFQVEQSASRRHEGAGLGLAFARQVARLMGGDIVCESTPGAGSTFTLWAPTDPPGAGLR